MISETLEILFSALDTLFLTKVIKLVRVNKYACAKHGGVIHVVLEIRGVLNTSFLLPNTSFVESHKIHNLPTKRLSNKSNIEKFANSKPTLAKILTIKP